MPRVLICGGRHFLDKAKLFAELDRLRKERGISVIIHGAGAGADALAGTWAVTRGIEVEPYPADWTKHGKTAGPVRNEQMLIKGRPTLVVAFPGGLGTADMVRRAKRAGVEVIEIPPTIEVAIAIQGRDDGGRHFCAGVVARDGKVVHMAPVLRRHIEKGWTGEQVAHYCRQRGWTWEKADADPNLAVEKSDNG